MQLTDKIKEAEKTLRLAANMSRDYYHKPLIICYSGGKDSDVLLDIAINCLNPEEIEVVNNHTTVDAPETVYHIRKVFQKLEEQGIKTEIRMPRYKGQPTSMWKLIVDMGSFPTGKQRFCCRILKETGTPKRLTAVGVREDESINRRNREAFTVRVKRKEDRYYMTTDHVSEVYQDSLRMSEDLGEPIEKVNAYDCRIIEAAKKNKDLIVNPIYKFTEKDIWAYIKEKDIETNPLYSRGYKRVGCIGCPLAGAKNMKRDFEDYPKYKENYIKAFDRMLERRRQKGKPFIKARNGEELMRIWLREDPKQIRLEDILPEDNLI